MENPGSSHEIEHSNEPIADIATNPMGVPGARGSESESGGEVAENMMGQPGAPGYVQQQVDTWEGRQTPPSQPFDSAPAQPPYQGFDEGPPQYDPNPGFEMPPRFDADKYDAQQEFGGGFDQGYEAPPSGTMASSEAFSQPVTGSSDAFGQPVSEDPFGASQQQPDSYDSYGQPVSEDPFGASQQQPDSYDSYGQPDAFGQPVSEDPFGASQQQPDSYNSYGQPDAFGQPVSEDPFGASQEPPSPDYPVYAQWEKEWLASLEKKRQEEQEHEENIKKKAEEDIDKFYDDLLDKRAHRGHENREKEQLVLEEIEELIQIASDNPWARVFKMIDIKTGENETVDKTRMRRILIELKEENQFLAMKS